MQRSFQWRVFFGQVSSDANGLFLTQVRGQIIRLQTFPSAGNKQKIRGKTVLVAGATGGVGSQVVQCLCNEGINVRALVRDYTKVVWPLDVPVPICVTEICFGYDQVAMLHSQTIISAGCCYETASCQSGCMPCRILGCIHRMWR